MLLLDDSSPGAVVVDPNVPDSHRRVHAVLAGAWPRLRGRIGYEPKSVEDFPLDADDVVVSSHACGALTDRVLTAAVAARARVWTQTIPDTVTPKNRLLLAQPRG